MSVGDGVVGAFLQRAITLKRAISLGRKAQRGISTGRTTVIMMVQHPAGGPWKRSIPVRIAKCCCQVQQWGFDESSLDGVPRFNQWCRIREGDAYNVVTIECSGLLPGASAEMVGEHMWRSWERGHEALNILRQGLGEEADTLVPLVNGGVTLAKLRSVMHDTCNHANKVARLAQGLRNDSMEEWESMEEYQVDWQDFCAGITRVISRWMLSTGGMRLT
jgi:hypothetical protein